MADSQIYEGDNRMITLKPHQERAVAEGSAILKHYGLVYLDMGMQTGKTFTSFCIGIECGFPKAVFVTKKSNITNIQAQAAHFPELEILVTTYGCFYKTASFIDDSTLIIIDEAHCYGTYPKPSARYKQARVLTKSRSIVFLSGTPTPESFSQLYHQLSLSSRSPWNSFPNFYAWAKEYVRIRQVEYQGRPTNNYDNGIKEKILGDFEKYRVIIGQEEAGFRFVEIEEEFLDVKMSSYTHMLFELMLKLNYIVKGTEGTVVSSESEASLQQKCHQICSGTLKLNDNESVIFDRTKAYAIADHAYDRHIYKFIVFYKYVQEGKMLREVFPNVIDDSVEFQEAREGVFLKQVVSGREGITLNTADWIYMFNIDFGWLSYDQAKNRVNGLHKTEQPHLVWVFGDTGLERAILKKVMGKKKFNSKDFCIFKRGRINK